MAKNDTAPQQLTVIKLSATKDEDGFETEQVIGSREFTAGTMIKGTYVGMGSPMVMEDAATKKVKELPTFRIALADEKWNPQGITAILLGSHEIARQMPTIRKGARVKLENHGKESLGGGKTVNRILVKCDPKDRIEAQGPPLTVAVDESEAA